MFARQTFKVVRWPLKNQYCRYTTELPSNRNSSATFYVVAAVLVGGGYYFYSRDLNNPQTVKDSMQEADAKVKELAGQSKDKVEGDVAGGALPIATFTGGDQGFISLKLESVEYINNNTKKFRFALSERDSVSGLPTTSALLTRFKEPGMAKPIFRPYTPVSDENEKGYLNLLVKRYPNGPMSEHLHSMEPSQCLDFKGPILKYPWSPNKHSHIALIAGGTGITPMYQLISAIFKNPDDRTKVTLVFGNIVEDDILFKKEFEALENKYPHRFRAFYVLNNPPSDSKIAKGMITKELLKTVLPDPKTENVKLFVCGPPGMYKAISGPKKSPADQGDLEGSLKELGYSKDQVYKF